DMFNAMMEAFMEEVVGFLFNLEVKVQPAVGLQTDEAGVPMSAEVMDELLASVAAEPAVAEPEPEAAEPAKGRPVVQAKGLGERQRRPVSYSAPSETGEAVTSRDAEEDPYAGVGRNAPCPCGSGKKYKMCHGRRS
ncbi:MAG TPA: SEC-C metal-binding domain-containing protein, partial [Micropruina sp.]|nr:SEC-C metal-binding domain-containing protein [Micropruina sp.]